MKQYQSTGTTSLFEKIARQSEKNKEARKPICLFCDLDDSYVMKFWPSEEIIASQSQKKTDVVLFPDLSVYEGTIRLKQYLDMHDIPLVIVSGRDLHQMNDLIRTFKDRLPQHPEIMDFDGIIGGVGTEIYLKNKEGGFEIDSDYALLLHESGFNRTRIIALLDEGIAQMRERFHPVELDFSKRDKHESGQEHPKQPYKVSLEFKTDKQTSQKLKEFVRLKLDAAGFDRVKILMSCPYSLSESLHKYNFDIVPFSKEKPIQFLRDEFKVSSLVVGDSGNDFEMLMHAADYGIVVGNAKQELIDAFAPLPDTAKKHVAFAPKHLMGPEAILDILQTMIPSEL